MGTRTADAVHSDAKEAGAGLEATRARQAAELERRLKSDLEQARAATDAAIVALKNKAQGAMSGTDIAVLLGFEDRQTVHMRAKRHEDRNG